MEADYHQTEDRYALVARFISRRPIQGSPGTRLLVRAATGGTHAIRVHGCRVPLPGLMTGRVYRFGGLQQAGPTPRWGEGSDGGTDRNLDARWRFDSLSTISRHRETETPESVHDSPSVVGFEDRLREVILAGQTPSQDTIAGANGLPGQEFAAGTDGISEARTDGRPGLQIARGSLDHPNDGTERTLLLIGIRGPRFDIVGRIGAGESVRVHGFGRPDSRRFSSPRIGGSPEMDPDRWVLLEWDQPAPERTSALGLTWNDPRDRPRSCTHEFLVDSTTEPPLGLCRAAGVAWVHETLREWATQVNHRTEDGSFPAEWGPGAIEEGTLPLVVPETFADRFDALGGFLDEVSGGPVTERRKDLCSLLAWRESEDPGPERNFR